MGSAFTYVRLAAAAVRSVFPPRLLPALLAVLVLLLASSCSGSPGPDPATTSPSPVPLTAAINQFRDNYSKQVIEIQLTNTTDAVLTVQAAAVRSPLFGAEITWAAADEGTELPPGQTKSLPASLPAATCPGGSSASPATTQPGGNDGTGTAGTGNDGAATAHAPTAGSATVRLRNASGAEGQEVLAVTDPFGVLTRNNAEMCVAQAAGAVADVRFGPELDIAADSRSAVVELLIAPRDAATPPGPATNFTINSVGGTTLLEEDAGAPWPHGLTVAATGPELTLRLGIRPARCDPHAVAEDKVGTLIPLRITVHGRDGVLKVDPGTLLRGRIYDFVTAACGRQ